MSIGYNVNLNAMKKYCLIIALIAFTQAFSFGQSETDTKRWQFGVFTGPQLAFLVPDESSKATKGLLAGADAGYRFQNSVKGWSVHLQPNFSMLRNKMVSGDESTVYYFTMKSKSHSIMVPFLVRYTILGGKIRPFAEVGGNWVVRTSVSYKTMGRFCPDGMPCSPLDIEDKIRNADVARMGALVSAGVQIDIGKVTIPITVRAIQDIKKQKIYIDDLGTEAAFPKTRLIQLTAGIAF